MDNDGEDDDMRIWKHWLYETNDEDAMTARMWCDDDEYVMRYDDEDTMRYNSKDTTTRYNNEDT